MITNIFATLEFDKILDHLTQLSVSPLGEALILQIQPIAEPDQVKQRLGEVTELKDILDFDDPFPITGLQDIKNELRKSNIAGNFLSTDELIRVVQTLEVARKINAYFYDRAEKYPLLSQAARPIHTFKAIEKDINRCIDASSFEIYDHASPNLNRIRRSIETYEQQIRKKMETIMASLARKGYLQESLLSVRDGRLVLMVKDEHKAKVQGLIHDQSATGSTMFIEPIETLQLNNQIRSLKIDERREIEAILRRLTDMIREQLPEIQHTVAALAQIDFIYAKARFSQEIKGSEPAINQDHRLEIVKGKHPLLALRHDASRPVIPLNLTIGKEFQTLVISGPNAGGKTVALKTIGLLCLMANSGLHIPADPGSDIPVFSNIFAGIGDQQSIENDLSTFSSHVARLRDIVDQVTPADLVLIDEIGSATDPDEGAALAIAILERLTKIACITIVSTHLGALKIFAHETSGVENGSMEFNRETLQPTYNFRVGIPGSSYASEIAKRWGLSDEIIHRAREIVGSKKNRFENLLEDLESRLQKYRSLSEEASIKQTELDGLIKLYQHKYDELSAEEKKLKKRAIEESEQIVQQANKAIELAIKKIKEEQASREAIKAAHELLNQQKEQIRQERKHIEKIPVQTSPKGKSIEKATVGDEVFWAEYQLSGTILSEPDAEGRVLIQTDGMKVKVPINDLTTASIKKQKTASADVRVTYEKRHSNELDIRGFRVEAALIEVDKFLDEAILTGLNEVYIIHGKGTGVLMKAVHEFLDRHRRVKSRGFPSWNLGDTGMTVVQLG